MNYNKVYIFTPYEFDPNKGGPIGFFSKCLFNNSPDNSVLLNIYDKVNLSFRKKLLLKIEIIKGQFSGINKRYIFWRQLYIKYDIKKYAAIFIHDYEILFALKPLIPSSQKVILQSHSPQHPSEEIFDRTSNVSILRKHQKIERIAFKRSDFLIFPNKSCKSIYKDLIPEMKRIFYVETGLFLVPKPKGQFQLNQDKINIVFVGRRNEVKGYNVLIESFEKAFPRNPKLNLILLGSGEKNIFEGIMDIGFSERVYDWISSADFVIIPNKRSYFDLNLLESLSLGTKVIMTTTEGHKRFENHPQVISFDIQNLEQVLINLNKRDNSVNEIPNDNFDFSGEKYKHNLENVFNQILQSK